MAKFKPMLAGKVEDEAQLRFPLLASPKLDGVRAMVQNGKLVSRKLIAIPNKYVNTLFSYRWYEGMDGELILSGAECDAKGFQKTSSAVMSRDGKPNVIWYVFDRYEEESGAGFKQRLDDLRRHLREMHCANVVLLEHEYVHNVKELAQYERKCLKAGYEGVMLRDPDGLYKEGRSTSREGWLLKLKRFVDSEGEVIGFEERMHNGNPAQEDNLGHTKRSLHKANMEPMDTLGAIVVREAGTKREFRIGTGFDDAQRKEIWTHRNRYRGRLAKFKYQDYGVKDKPRIPVFIGFRDRRDM